MFNQCSLPSMSLQASEFKVWDEQGKPNPLPTGVQASFGDVTLGRGVDSATELYKWISNIAQNGCTSDTVKEVTLIACNAAGEPVQEWTLTDAYPSSYSPPGWQPRDGRPDGADHDQVHRRQARRRGRLDGGI